MSSLEERNKQLAVDFFSKAINEQNFEAMAQILSPIYTYNGDASSLEGNKEWVIGLHTQYPGLMFTFDDILAEGDTVAFRWRMTAPAAGPRPAGWLTGTNIVHVVNGQIISNYQNSLSSDSWTPKKGA